MRKAMKVIKMTYDQNLSGDPSDAMAKAPPRPVQAVKVIPIERAWRESGLDETLAETFPCSDPLSSIPDPRDFGRS
jgi:hypothetical protein